MSEQDLCERFSEVARKDGWTIYPEQGPWGLLLVRGGVQVGVQAKITASVHMLLQALPDHLDQEIEGPHYRAVLFERVAGRTSRARQANRREIYQLAQHLRLLVLQPPEVPRHTWLYRWQPSPNLLAHPNRVFVKTINWRFYRWWPRTLEWIPPFVPDLPAGVPNPRKVRPWALAACALEQIYAERGWVCLEDARKVTEAHSGSWKPRSLLQRFYGATSARVKDSRQYQWKRQSWNPVPSKKYPEVAAGLGMV